MVNMNSKVNKISNLRNLINAGKINIYKVLLIWYNAHIKRSCIWQTYWMRIFRYTGKS